MRSRNTELFNSEGAEFWLGEGYSVKQFSFTVEPRFDGMEALVAVLNRCFSWPLISIPEQQHNMPLLY